MNRMIKNLKENGFVNAGRLALSDIEVNELANLSRYVFDSVQDVTFLGRKHPDYILDPGTEGVMRLPQLNSRIAEILDKVVSDDKVQTLLNDVLGYDYKIWQINYRRSKPGDQGLNFHQDSFGETNLCIMLGDNFSGNGATLFLAGSHLVSTRMRKWKIEAPSFLLRYLDPLLTKLKGKAGDISFFFNRTWHGRSHNSTHLTYDVILMSFFPCGATFGYEGYGKWSNEFLKDFSDTRLGMLINPDIGTDKLENGRYKVSNLTMTNVTPFAVDIEDGKIPKLQWNKYKMHLTILLLRFIFLFRPIVRLARMFRGKP